MQNIVRREFGGHSPRNDIQVLKSFNDARNRAGISGRDDLETSPEIWLRTISPFDVAVFMSEHDLLRAALRRTLENGDACMEFLVQRRTSDTMDVEDSRIEWKEAQAPFSTVATIRIPRQVFDTPEQNEFCENLSFTPWHSLPEHKPLGITNRLRKLIYDHISRVRHEMNEAKQQEPQ